jgi:hypothetical protein
METWCSLDRLDLEISRLRASIGDRDLAHTEFVGILPSRTDGFSDGQRRDFHAEFIVRLCRGLGVHLKPLVWKELEAMEKFVGYEVVELNEGFLCADSALTHHLLGRGATLFGGVASMKRASGEPGVGKFVALSPYHGMRVREKLGFKPCASPLDELMPLEERFLAGEAQEENRRFPWPLWFMEWAKEHAGLAAR